MLTTTVIDPELIRAVAGHYAKRDGVEDEQWLALLRQMLRIVFHSHVLVRAPQIARDTLNEIQKLQSTAPDWYQLLEPLLAHSPRLVELPEDPSINASAEDALRPDPNGTEIALTLSNHDAVDVVLTTEDVTELYSEGIALDRSKIVTPTSYPRLDMAENDASRWGGVLLSRLSPDDVIRKWIEPFLRWSREVTIVDQYIGRSCMEIAPFAIGGPASNNWSRFQTTLRRIYKAWQKGDKYCEKKLFEVITTPLLWTGKITKNPSCWEEIRQDLVGGGPDDQDHHDKWYEARYIHEQLANGEDMSKALKVTLVANHHNRDIAHDRWIINRTAGTALLLSRGFDLFSGSQTLPCLICFMRELPKNHTWCLADIEPQASYSLRGNNE